MRKTRIIRPAPFGSRSRASLLGASRPASCPTPPAGPPSGRRRRRLVRPLATLELLDTLLHRLDLLPEIVQVGPEPLELLLAGREAPPPSPWPCRPGTSPVHPRQGPPAALGPWSGPHP